MKTRFIIRNVCLILFLIIMISVITGLSKGIDNFVYNNLIRNEFFDNYFLFITNMGGIIFMVIFVPTLFFAFKDIKIIYLSLGGVGFNTIMKTLVHRKRPDINRMISERGYSFPSGHSLISSLVFGYLICKLNDIIKNKFIKCLVIGIIICIILSIGISRIYLGVHYFSDVLCGFLEGVIILLTFLDRSVDYVQDDGK